MKAASVAKYGPKAMAAVNSGKAQIGYAAGGPVGFADGGAVGRGLQIHAKFPSQSVVNALVNKAVADMAQRWASSAAAFGGAGSAAIVADAMRWIGKIPYVWGGTAVPGGADCSGFTSTIYGRHGIRGVPRTSEAQGAWVRKTPPIPGGLAFYNSPAGGSPPGHVAIVGRDGMVISQGGGMGPQYVPLNSMALMFTGIPPGGFAKGGPVRKYDSGGWMPPGLSLSYNGTGGWERLNRDRGGGDSGGVEARLDALIRAVERNARQTGTALAGALDRGGRRAAYAGIYSS